MIWGVCGAAGSAGLSHPVLSTPQGPEGVATKYGRMVFPPTARGAKKPKPSKALRSAACTADFTETVVKPDEAVEEGTLISLVCK